MRPVKAKDLPAPACQSEISDDPSEAQWFERVKVTKGGTAGKGLVPPEPPAMSVDGSSEYPNMTEELDSGEVEGKTKMAFAKMQVPHNVKELHQLSDTDFMLNPEREEGSLSADSKDGPNTPNELSDEPSLESQSVPNSASPSPKRGESSPPRGIGRSGSIRGLGSRQTSNRFTPDASGVNSGSSKSKDAGSSPDKQPKKKTATLRPLENKPKDLPSMSEQAARLGLYA